MKSIKPGRGPSLMGGVVSLLVGLGGVFWVLAAASSGAPLFFCLFGVIFIVIAVIQGVYQLYNAKKRNRFSVFDMTDETEEPDPLNARFHSAPPNRPVSGVTFCPYCGAPAEPDFAYCRKCGKALPKE